MDEPRARAASDPAVGEVAGEEEAEEEAEAIRSRSSARLSVASDCGVGGFDGCRAANRAGAGGG